MEFKKLSAVEAVNEVADTANVLIEEDGVIKKAPKTAVGAQFKELMYEWNFGAEDEVYELCENVNDDLTWLTEKSDNIGWEITVEMYAQYHDEELGENCIEADLTSMTGADDNSYYTGYYSNHEMSTYLTCYAPEDFYNGWNKSYFEPHCDVYVYNKLNIDFDSWETVQHMNVGGAFYFTSDSSYFKSIKIYKITR